MLSKLQQYRSPILTSFVGLFFILILHFRFSYSVFPILFSLISIAILVSQYKSKTLIISRENKILTVIFSSYFLLFLFSLIIQKGKGNELEFPSRALLVLPLLLVSFAYFKLRLQAVLYALLFASLIAGIVAFIQVQFFKLPEPFPQHMRIQSGDIVMSLALFCLCIAFYAYTNRYRLMLLLSMIATLFGLLASLATEARGAWVGLPIVLIAILFFNRQLLSKKVMLAIGLLALIVGAVGTNVAVKRWNQASSDIVAYVEKNNGRTSVGARLDMWKSAMRGIVEKPLFGWGLQGVKEMRKQHAAEGYINVVASKFDHAHNQYLQDMSARGILGGVALLAILFYPLYLFAHYLKQSQVGSYAHLFGVLGVVHILAIIFYNLTQSFLSHNSGVAFYFFPLAIFLGLQRLSLSLNK